MTRTILHHDTSLWTLPNGVRVLHLCAPHLQTVAVSVFVHSGSAHEPRSLNGISHVVEHMVFKGSRLRDARRINRDAERLGAQVDAHTDKDHTAFHMRGMAADAPAFVAMLADIVCHPRFPADELENERRVLLQEFSDDEDDPVTVGFRLFDRACYGMHPVGNPVIGTRAHIERFTREDLLDFVGRRFTGANLVLAAIGPPDVERALRAGAEAFAVLPAGMAAELVPPPYRGGVRMRAQAGSGQSHLVLGFPVPGRAAGDPVSLMAATLFGEGMSSPLLGRLREELGLVYHAGCSADVMEGCGQFVVEASTAPDKLAEVLQSIVELLARQAGRIAPAELERARRQLAVRLLQTHEHPARRLEEAALDLFSPGTLRSPALWAEQVRAVTAHQLRKAFEAMFAAGPSLALTGRVGPRAADRARQILGGLPAPGVRPGLKSGPAAIPE